MRLLLTKQQYTVELKLQLIRKLICAFFILGILCSFKLWLSDRSFPLLPVVDTIYKFQSPFDIALISILILLMSINIIHDSMKLYYAIFLFLFILLLQDQMRWQPWVYIYTLMLLPCLIKQTEQEAPITLNYLQLIISGIYFWSGLHKLNANFTNTIFKSILIDLFRIDSPTLIEKLCLWGHCIPVVEILTGLLLLASRTRQIGIWLACTMHLFVLFYLGPLGINSNSIVYPWNVGMMTFVFILFWKAKNKPFLLKGRSKLSLAALSTLTLIWIFPLLNFFHRWDNYLSFSLYSGKIKNYYIAVEEKECEKVIEKYNPSFIDLTGITGGKIIDVNKWSMDDLNVPFYAERRVFKKLSKDFCDLGIDEGKLIFLEFDGPISEGKYVKFTCKELNPD